MVEGVERAGVGLGEGLGGLRRIWAFGGGSGGMVMGWVVKQSVGVRDQDVVTKVEWIGEESKEKRETRQGTQVMVSPGRTKVTPFPTHISLALNDAHNDP